jgi:hypothetical protein
MKYSIYDKLKIIEIYQKNSGKKHLFKLVSQIASQEKIHASITTIRKLIKKWNYSSFDFFFQINFFD